MEQPTTVGVWRLISKRSHPFNASKEGLSGAAGKQTEAAAGDEAARGPQGGGRRRGHEAPVVSAAF